MLMDIDVNFNNNDKIDDMSVTVTYELSDTYKPQIDTLISTMNSTYKNRLNGDHFKINTTKISDKAFKTSICSLVLSVNLLISSILISVIT